MSTALKRGSSTANERPRASDLVVGFVIVLLWFVLKVWYREGVKEQYGFFSWPYLRADLISFAVLLVVGVLLSWSIRLWHGRRHP